MNITEIKNKWQAWLNDYSMTPSGELCSETLEALELAEKTQCELTTIVGIIQQLQPAGSPPPTDTEGAVRWIVRETINDLGMLKSQRDQLLHLLAGGALSEDDVKASGLGVGVLSEQRHHEYMRCKAERERDVAILALDRLKVEADMLQEAGLNADAIYRSLVAILGVLCLPCQIPRFFAEKIKALECRQADLIQQLDSRDATIRALKDQL